MTLLAQGLYSVMIVDVRVWDRSIIGNAEVAIHSRG